MKAFKILFPFALLAALVYAASGQETPAEYLAARPTLANAISNQVVAIGTSGSTSAVAFYASSPVSTWTNAIATLGYGGVQLSSKWYGQDGGATGNSRGGIEFWKTDWDGVPKLPDDDVTVPESAIRCVRDWGAASSFDVPTMHFFSRGNMRFEPFFSGFDTDAEYFGNCYMSLGNEDVGNNIYVNYLRGSVFNHMDGAGGTNAQDGSFLQLKPYMKGYGLPVTFLASYTKNNTEGQSRPAIWAHSGDTNAADMRLGELWFCSLNPTMDIWAPTIDRLQNPQDQAVVVAKMKTNYFEVLLEGLSVSNAGVSTTIKSNRITTGTVTANNLVGLVTVAPTVGGAFANQSSGTALNPTYYSPYSHYMNPNAPDYASAPLANACTLTNFYVNLVWAEQTATYTFRLFTNGVFTGMTCQISGAASASFTRVGSDLTHAATIAAGTVLSLQTTNSTGAGAAIYGGWAVQMR